VAYKKLLLGPRNSDVRKLKTTVKQLCPANSVEKRVAESCQQLTKCRCKTECRGLDDASLQHCAAVDVRTIGDDKLIISDEPHANMKTVTEQTGNCIYIPTFN